MLSLLGDRDPAFLSSWTDQVLPVKPPQTQRAILDWSLPVGQAKWVCLGAVYGFYRQAAVLVGEEEDRTFIQ